MKKYILQSKQNLKNNTEFDDCIKELNESQKDVVFHNDGALLVIAGAGSGKTKTLVYRVSRLVNQGVAPQSILLLTFTRKASREMLHKATTLLDSRCQNVSGGTFHSFSNDILREFAHFIQLDSQFTILDRSDAEDLLNDIRYDLGFSQAEKRFPKKSTIASIISKSINTEKSIMSILADHYSQFCSCHHDILKISLAYSEKKRLLNLLDYDDLLTYLVVLLRDCKDVSQILQKRFQYIMVHEYQDTNNVQSQIIQHLTNSRSNIMVVGDDAQSIYSFRGANFQNIMQFSSLFPEVKVIKLEKNYRSTQAILNLTNAIMANSVYGYSKNLFTTKKGGDLPVFVETRDEYEQSQFVCQRILELREEGIELNDMAILIRSGWHSNDIETVLMSYDIPFAKYGGMKFIEASHIKDVLAYLRIIYNVTDVISWRRVLQLINGIGSKTANDIFESIRNNQYNILLGIRSFEKRAFYPQLKELVSLVKDSSFKELDIVIASVLLYYTPIFESKYDDFLRRRSDLDSIQGISRRANTLGQFLSDMSLEPPDSSIASNTSDQSSEKVTISTIHSAKGLEWKVVFLISTIDGYLPSMKSFGHLEQIEEERRLLYVALTRAKDYLYILKPNLDKKAGYYHSGMLLSKPSRFLEENNILDTYTEKCVLVEEDSVFENDVVDYRRYNL